MIHYENNYVCTYFQHRELYVVLRLFWCFWIYYTPKRGIPLAQVPSFRLHQVSPTLTEWATVIRAIGF